ncbi:hypothetical protein BH10CYA1_BH10CYA1_34360 [soil metagenome]
MDRPDTSDNQTIAPNLALTKLQTEALPAATKSESKGVTDILGDAIHSALYTGIQEPISGITQIVDEFAGTKFLSKMQLISAPEQAKFGSADWHAQQVGSAVGMLLPFLLVRKGVRGVLGTTAAEEAGLLSKQAAFGMNMKEAGLTGFAYDAFLRPSQPNNGGLGQFLLDRGTQGAVGAGTFMTMTGAGLGLNRLAGASAVERSALIPILRNPVATGIISGIPAGLFSAEANSLTKTGHLASGTELGQSVYGTALIGGGFGLAHSLTAPGAEGAPSRLENLTSKIKSTFTNENPVRDGLTLASGDRIGREGATHSVAPEQFELSAKPTTFAETARRITGYESTSEPLVVSKPGAPTTFESDADFLRNGVERVDTPVRVYSVEGQGTKIIVPETYALQLDAVRQFRLGLEGTPQVGDAPLNPSYLNRALPEDFIPHLDALPNKGLMEKLYLMDTGNPMDPVHQAATGNPLFESQASNTNESVTFYRKNVDRFIGDELRHEWSHQARNQMPTESSAFDLAAQHEGKNFIPRERALDAPEEYWSVLLGEELLNPSSTRFLELTRQIPLQSVFLANGLSRTMAEAPAESGAGKVSADQLQGRIRYLQDVIKPQVTAQLVSEVQANQDPGRATTAARLLIRLGEGQRLNEIATMKSLDLAGEPVGAGTLKQIENNTVIENLNLDSTYVGENGLAFLEKMPLKTLSLEGTKTQGSALQSLENIQTLERLNLSYTQVNDNGLFSLYKLPNLKYVDLTHSNVTADAVAWLRAQMPNTDIVYSP